MMRTAISFLPLLRPKERELDSVEITEGRRPLLHAVGLTIVHHGVYHTLNNRALYAERPLENKWRARVRFWTMTLTEALRNRLVW